VSGETALAVDDYAPSRYTHAHALRTAGFDVVQATDGHTGLSMAQVHLPHVVLLDVNLPDMHGFEVCERLKQSRLTRHIPVIHLTATSRGDRYRRESVAAGADLFLEEPLEQQDLIRRVREIVSSRWSAPSALANVLLLTPFDDESFLYQTALQTFGHQVTCGDPEHGYELARSTLPDVIVSRIRPNSAGLDMAKAVKSDPRTADIPVVIVTTYTDNARRSTAERAGVDAYYVLPLLPDKLVEVVSRLCQR
jgi:CheY-like chemotaxis protein